MARRRRRVVWTHQARSALEDVLAYIAGESPRGANVVLEEALAAAGNLAAFAEGGRVVPELDDASVREVFVRRYRLMYQVGDADVRILAFLHGSRDFAKWRKRQ